METSTSTLRVCTVLMVVLVCTVESASYLAFPRMGRARPGYLAFPRMGRSNPGYIAFPRMGRSQVKQQTGSDCCSVGMKSVFAIGDDGKEDTLSVCNSNAQCCSGLREVVDQKAEGVYFSMCVPDVPTSASSDEGSSEVLSKLKRMLQ